VLPSGVTPLTAVTTTVRYGDDEHALARFRDGHEEKHPLAALTDLVTERGNPGNRRGIADVTVYLAAPVLAGGVELVDTPGNATAPTAHSSPTPSSICTARTTPQPASCYAASRDTG